MAWLEFVNSAMNIESVREYAIAKPRAEEGFPFGDDVVVFKVDGRIFLLLPLNTEPHRFNVKCDPDQALQLRDEYPDTILPGYHMNKKHWNTVLIDGRIKKALLQKLIDDSYGLVAKNKKK